MLLEDMALQTHKKIETFFFTAHIQILKTQALQIKTIEEMKQKKQYMLIIIMKIGTKYMTILQPTPHYKLQFVMIS
jgi:hypothetical protein